MNKVKINVTNTEKIDASKRAVKAELLASPFIVSKMKELNCTDEEFDKYLGYFLAYYEDRIACGKCSDYKKCTKQFEGVVIDLHRGENGIERSYSLCAPRELERIMSSNYLVRDFPDSYLTITLDNMEKKKGRFSYEKELLKTDIEGDNQGLFVNGPSSCGKSYPLIALCNEFVRGGKKCAYLDTRNFLESLKNLMNFGDEYNALLNKVKEADVLVFDNLGDEKISEWTRDDVVGGILDYRIRNGLLTYITSCYSLDELLSLYNVSKTGNSEAGKIKANKLIERIKLACPKQISIN